MFVGKCALFGSLFVLGIASGCGGDPGPGSDAGVEVDGGTEPDAGTDGGGDQDAGTDGGMIQDAGTDAGMTPVSFATQVQPIFNSNCIGCHPGSGGFSLAAGSSRASLVDVNMVGFCTTLKRVAPGDSVDSGLYRKISGTTCGARMPSGGTLSAGQIETIKTWIDEGALDN